jgi:hypothetical protein
MEAHALPGENISMLDITDTPFSPDIIASFIRMIEMNQHLRPENSLDIDTILKNSPNKVGRLAEMVNPQFVKE